MRIINAFGLQANALWSRPIMESNPPVRFISLSSPFIMRTARSVNDRGIDWDPRSLAPL